MSQATFYKQQVKYSGLDASMMSRLKELEGENPVLKRCMLKSALSQRLSKSNFKKVVKPSQRKEIAQ